MKRPRKPDAEFVLKGALTRLALYFTHQGKQRFTGDQVALFLIAVGTQIRTSSFPALESMDPPAGAYEQLDRELKRRFHQENMVKVSLELVQDSAFNMEDYIAGGISDATGYVDPDAHLGAVEP